MNIFILDYDHQRNVEMYCDKHVVKMLLETAQLLCSVHHALNSRLATTIPYRATHINHPCAVWSRASQQNYDWLVSLGWHLGREYEFRYGKEHKSAEVVKWAALNSPYLPSTGLTPFTLCLPTTFKKKDAVEAYRAYYRNKYIESLDKPRARMAWKNRNKPNFLEKTASN